jgi:hypothetical protein
MEAIMKRIKYERVHVPYFCEQCGKETFEGVVFGREVSRQVAASGKDRRMWCNDCDPNPRPLVIAKLDPSYLQPIDLDSLVPPT